MTASELQAAQAAIQQTKAIRVATRETFSTQDGLGTLAMLLLESTMLETDSAKQNPVLAAHFATLLYTMGINHPRNISRIAAALLEVANDDDLDARLAELANQEEG